MTASRLARDGAVPVTAGEPRHRWGIWWRALRVPSFSATVVPLAIGSAYAAYRGFFQPDLVVAMLIAAVACQAGANLANDYFDAANGIDSAARPGSSTVLQRGWLSARQILRGMIIAFALATILGFWIVAHTGWPIFFLALASLVLAVLYSAGPLPLSHITLGEVVTFLTMGLALGAGAYVVLAGNLTLAAVLVALPNAFIVTALLHINNTRDIERDRSAGKRTVAQRLGRSGASTLLAVLFGAAFLSLLAAVVGGALPWPLLITALALPRAVMLLRRFHDAAVEQEQAYTAVLRAVNRFQLEFGALLVAGTLIATVLRVSP